MLAASTSENASWQFTPEQLRAKISDFLPEEASAAEKISAIETALLSPMGESLRGAMAQWIVD